MSVECFPVTVLPHVSQIYRDYLAMEEHADVRRWYGAEAFAGKWIGKGVPVGHADALADLLAEQAVEFGAGDAAKANIERLRAGAHAVVTGAAGGVVWWAAVDDLEGRNGGGAGEGCDQGYGRGACACVLDGDGGS